MDYIYEDKKFEPLFNEIRQAVKDKSQDRFNFLLSALSSLFEINFKR